MCLFDYVTAAPAVIATAAASPAAAAAAVSPAASAGMRV